MKFSSLLKFTSLAASILALIGLAAPAQAQNITWDNTATDFNDAGSWTGLIVPGTGNRAVFGGAPATNQPQLTANLEIQGLTFGNAAWNLSSSNTTNQLTLTSTGSGAASAISYGNTSTTISANLVLGGALNSTQQITYSDNFDTNTISGVISDAGNNVGLQINYGNSNTVVFSSLNTYTGNTTFASNQTGNIRALTTIGNQNAAGAFGRGTTLNFNSGVGNAIFQYSAVNGGETSNKIFAMGGTTGGLEISAGQSGTTTELILTSDLAITGSGNKTLTLAGNPAGGLGRLNRFDGVIADGSGPTAGSVISVTKGGANANWTLGGNNTFSGNVAILEGTLTVAKFGNQGSTTSNLGAGTTLNHGTGGGTSATLNYTGVGETSNRIINLAGTTGGATINNNGTGALILTSNLTATGVGSKTLTLGGAGNGEITGDIVNSGTVGSTISTSNANNNVATITLASVDGVIVGAAITGTGVAPNTTITAINTGTRAVTLSANTTAQALAGTSYNVAGVQNMTALTKAGAGTWTLTGAKSYTGVTTITAGTLEVNNKSSLGTGTIVMNGGALQASANLTGANKFTNDMRLLGANSFITGTNSLEIGGTLFQDLAGSRALNNNLASGSMLTLNDIDINRNTSGNSTLSLGGTGTTTVAGVIANGNATATNGLSISGPVILAGNNTYSGTTTIGGGGRLQISDITNLGVNLGPLQFQNNTTSTAALELRSDGNATFAKNASGVSTTALDSIAEFNVDRLTSSGPSNGTITWGGVGNNLIFNNDRGQFLVTGANGYGLTMNQNLSWAGSNQTNKANIVNNAPGLLTLEGNLIAQSVNIRSFEISGTGDILVNGTITGGGYFLNKTGTNTLTLNNTVTTPTTGGVTISGGTVRLGANGTLATSAPLTVNAGTMDLNGINTTITALGLGNGLAGTTANVTTGAGILTLGGTVTYNSPLNANGATVSGNINLGNAGRAFVVNDSINADNDLTISAVISGGGASGAITKSGAGTLALTANNSAALSGTTTINSGMIAVGNNGAFGTGQVRLNATGTSTVAGIQSTDGTARTINNVLGTFSGTTPVYTFGAATGAGTGNLSFTNTTAVSLDSAVRNFTVNNTTTFANAFTSTGGITKNGNGTLILTGNSSYTGATNVSAGTLIVDGTFSGTGSATVSFGATLGGSGTLAGATTVDGIVAPGNSIGQLNITNNVTWNGTLSNAWKFELGAGNSADLLNITGNFLKGGGSDFVFDFANTGQVGTFKLVDWSGTTGFAFTDFSYTNLGGSNTGTFAFNGSQLEIVVVPEPSTLVIFTGALLALIVLRRRRRMNA